MNRISSNDEFSQHMHDICILVKQGSTYLYFLYCVPVLNKDRIVPI